MNWKFEKCITVLFFTLVCVLIMSSTAFSAGYSVEYRYDEMNRLTQEVYNDNIAIGYSYDNVGNRLAKGLSDMTPPITSATPLGGVFSGTISVTLSCDDGTGSGCDKTYYTLDNSIPTQSSMLYSGQIAIESDVNLKFFSLDLSGNSETIRNQAYTIFPASPTPSVSVSMNPPGPKTVGTIVEIAATATGEDVPYLYRLRILDGEGNPVAVWDYDTSSNFQWDTWGLQYGSYNIEASIKGASSSVDNDAFLIYPYVLLERISNLTLLVSHKSPQAPGNEITFVASAQGGSGSYEYKYSLLANGNLSIAKDYSEDNTWVWNTTGLDIGAYAIRVDVRYAGSSSESETYRAMPFQLDNVWYAIDTYAGGLTGAVPAVSANLSNPSQMAIDNYGNIYIADTYNNRVRRINYSDNTIVTVAGNGFSGFSGDNGPATDASISLPISVVLDAQGNVYISDFYNNRVRKVLASDNTIITIAGGGEPVDGFGDGGLAVDAALSSPGGIALDSQGNLYIADIYHDRVRKVNSSDNVISTVVGGGEAPDGLGDGGAPTQACLMNPWGVVVDSQGSILIADAGHNRIRKANLLDNTISTLAGNGMSGYSGDNGIATEATLTSPLAISLDDQGNLYIADTYNSRIRKINMADNIISTIAGGGNPLEGIGDDGLATDAVIQLPYGVTVDSQENIYLADTYNQRIRKISASDNRISTIAGNGTSTFSGDGESATSAMFNSSSVAIDNSGNIYISDVANNRIRKVSVLDNTIDTVVGGGNPSDGLGDGTTATEASLNNPYGMTFDPQGNIYISDFANNRIRRVNASDNIIITVAGGGNPPDGLGDGEPAVLSGLYMPAAIALDTQGNLYIADSANNRIRMVKASDNTITTFAGGGTPPDGIGDGGLATQASLNQPYGVAVDGQGNVYIADTGNNLVRKVNVSDNVITTIAGGGNPPDDLGDGGLATLASLGSPTSIAVDSQGNLYVNDANSSLIRKIYAIDGKIRTVAGNGNNGYSGDKGPAIQASISPVGIAIDNAGNLFIASGDRIRWISNTPYMY